MVAGKLPTLDHAVCSSTPRNDRFPVRYLNGREDGKRKKERRRKGERRRR